MRNIAPQEEYAGDVSAQDAWAILASDPKAQLVDVRTAAEWTYVGTPDLSELARDAQFVEWQTWPTGALNPRFAERASQLLREAGADTDTPVLFLCRSGGRSRAAAIAMTRAGWTRAYNVVPGFEGDLDDRRQRGTLSGWKVSGLPWRQS